MELQSIVYDGSPFVPAVYPDTLKRITDHINKRKIAPSAAIAAEVALAGIALNDLHKRDYEWLVYQFQLEVLNLSHFLFGFTTPPALILGSHLLMSRTYAETFAILSPHTTDPLVISLNQHKANLIFETHPAYLSMTRKTPEAICGVIWDICEKNPFSQDVYYLAGLESSRRLFTGYAQKITLA